MPPDPYHGQKGRLKMYPWFKLLHLFFIISWFAGLFYLPPNTAACLKCRGG